MFIRYTDVYTHMHGHTNIFIPYKCLSLLEAKSRYRWTFHCKNTTQNRNTPFTHAI